MSVYPISIIFVANWVILVGFENSVSMKTLSTRVLTLLLAHGSVLGPNRRLGSSSDSIRPTYVWSASRSDSQLGGTNRGAHIFDAFRSAHDRASSSSAGVPTPAVRGLSSFELGLGCGLPADAGGLGYANSDPIPSEPAKKTSSLGLGKGCLADLGPGCGQPSTDGGVGWDSPSSVCLKPAEGDIGPAQ
ncbi:hypothetical protein Salat_1200900 [Sesamum alatum]|uniref:Uncharacterized protein n=1 Tax=Sesamum alatum TaxID=300844 RepID=A0AAE1YF54_9LAMI|nr:hypothetical protein Salat_1200900 [Sesamum alatum]